MADDAPAPVADQIEETRDQLADAKQDYADAETKQERAEARARAERMEAKLDQLISDNKSLSDRVGKVEATPVAPAPKPAEKPAEASGTPTPATPAADPAGTGSAPEKKPSIWWGNRG
jgi:hypothetical protein